MKYNVFTKARIKLTLWYMCISYAMLAFMTLAVIAAYTRTFEVVHQAILDQGRGIVFDVALQKEISLFEHNFIQRLLLIDLLIAFAAGLASYVLSGRTLRPIERMVAQQQQFAADASHELRTPLANITMEIAAYRQHKKIPAQQQQLLSSIEQEAKRMSAIVAGLLSLVRLHNASAVRQNVDLSAMTQAVIDTMMPRFKQAKLSIQSHIDPGMHTRGNPDEMRQLVLILLENALLYSTPGTTVTLKLGKEEGQIRLSVNNRGTVIPAKELSKIFNRFYRIHTNIPGTGLGLAIALSIVQSHHGIIAVASTAKQGTTFRVLLPAQQSNPE